MKRAKKFNLYTLLGFSLVLVVIVILLYSNFFGNMTGRVTGEGEHSITLYSSKSGLMASGESDISFKKLEHEEGYIGGSNDYRHYEYFSLASIPFKVEIISAKLILARSLSGPEMNISVRIVKEQWQEYQSYKTKGRYPLVFEEAVDVSGKEDLVFDVSSFVQEMIKPGLVRVGDYGFEFSSKDEPRYFYFRNAVFEEDKPRLEIVYSTKLK